MPARQEIPGFYFDEEKNRYFPIKGPIPGRAPKRPPPRPPPAASAEAALASSSSSSSSFSCCSSSLDLFSPGEQHIKLYEGRLMNNVTARRKRRRTTALLQVRELHGRLIPFNESRCKFEQEYEKVQLSHPWVWKYQNTDLISDSALQQFHVQVQTPEGQMETDVLSTGSMGGSISLYEVGKVGRHLGYGFNSIPKLVWPPSINDETAFNSVHGTIWNSVEASTRLSSSVSSILKIGKHSYGTAGHRPSLQNALVTTLGSGALGGSVYFLNFSEPLDFSLNALGHQRTSKIASFDFTIWTAACNSSGTQAALGTNRGASLLNLETGRLSWLYHTKSDIFSQQFDQSGNVVLCGLRNGSIVAADVREKHLGSLRHFAASHRGIVTPASNMSLVPLRIQAKKGTVQRHQMRNPCCQSALMPSAVCSLVCLLSDEQYFLGSSMDGSIKLFDKRLLHRGAVQSYEGHVNSHSHIELGVNPSETLVMSGGEDCYLRIWSIKSGELIFAENVSQSILKTVCWPQNGDHLNGLRRHFRSYNFYDLKQSFGAWLGSREGLFSVHGA